MSKPEFTLPRPSHFTARETDSGWLIVSADKPTDPTRNDGQVIDEATGLVWFAYRDGMAAGRVGVHPADARRFAADLLAAADATEAIERERNAPIKMAF